MTVGTELRQAREQRGLSLRDLSERTNIRQAVLRAIETDDFARLPGGVITRGFLKLYAREVGLEPDAIWQRYEAQAVAVGPEQPAVGDIGPRLFGEPATPVARSRPPVVPVLGALVVVALLAVGYVVSRPTARPGASGGDAPPAGSPSTAEPLVPAVPTEPAAPAERAAAAQPAAPTTATGTTPAMRPLDPPSASGESTEGVLRVDLHATGPCWVSATADGAQVVYRQLNPGDRQSIRVTDGIVLRIGMPGNLEVSLNGEPLPPSARPGTPVTIRLTPENYRERLRQEP